MSLSNTPTTVARATASAEPGAFKKRLLGCVTLGLGMLSLAGPAFAQEPASPGPEEFGLEEIIVTAQKREQNLQEVPLAVSAISAEILEQIGVRDTRDLSGLAPSVTVVQGTTSNTAGVISMRGITSPASESFGLDSANALYIDGVYIARSGAAGMDVMDLARVEVLRGPQGTLFGRNSTGGALALVSRDPAETFSASASLTAGNFGHSAGKFSLDTGRAGPITATVSYSKSSREGFVDNILEPDSKKDPGSREVEAFRAAVVFDIGDAGRIRYIYDQSTTSGTAYAFQLTNVANGTARPPLSVNGQPGITVTQQAPVQQLLAGVTFLDPRCAALAAPTRDYRDTICLGSDEVGTDDTWGNNLQFEYDFDAFRLKTTTGYRQWDSFTRGSDLDGLGPFRSPLFTNASLLNGLPQALLAFIPTVPAAARPFVAAAPVPTTTQGLFDTNNVRNHEQFSQEIEVSGETDAFDWVVGAFYFEEEGGEVNPQNSGFVLDTNGIFLGNFGALGPQLAAANPARYRLVVTNGLLEYNVKAQSQALYGQGTWYVDGRDGDLSITAGLRQTSDDKSIVRFQSGATRPSSPDRGAASFDKLTWNLMARYEVNDDISTYARVATGYRAGGFNAPDTTQAGTTTLVPFRPESLTSYEAGVKTETFGGRLRLNGAIYYNKYTDFAVNIPVVTSSPGIFGSRIVNAGEVAYTGAEIEGEALLSRYLSADFAIGYVDAETQQLLIPTSGAPGSPIVDIASINVAGYTSEWTGNIALNANFPTGFGDSEIIGRISYRYESPKYSFSNNLSTPFNEQIRSDTINNVDAQLIWSRVAVGGADLDFRLWGRNLFDENDFVRAIDFGALGYAGGIFGDPRTFGVTVSARY